MVKEECYLPLKTPTFPVGRGLAPAETWANLMLEPNDPLTSLTRKCASALTPTTSWGSVGINPTKKRKKKQTALERHSKGQFSKNTVYLERGMPYFVFVDTNAVLVRKIDKL